MDEQQIERKQQLINFALRMIRLACDPSMSAPGPLGYALLQVADFQTEWADVDTTKTQPRENKP